MKRYLIDTNNEDFNITLGYQSDISLVVNGLPESDVSGHTFKFDIGEEGETAIFTGTATIIDPFSPNQTINLSIPFDAFTEVRKQLVLQIRWTDLEPVERVIFKGFIDVLKAVLPNP